MKAPKEDPEDKKARLRERRMSLLEQSRTAQNSARDMTDDIRGTYGLGGLSLFGTRGSFTAPKGGSIFTVGSGTR